MHGKAVVGQEDPLFDRAADPEQGHARQHGAAQHGAGQIVRQQETKCGDTEKNVDQTQIEDLDDRPVGDGVAAQVALPVEQLPETDVEEPEGQAVQAAEEDEVRVGHDVIFPAAALRRRGAGPRPGRGAARRRPGRRGRSRRP